MTSLRVLSVLGAGFKYARIIQETGHQAAHALNRRASHGLRFTKEREKRASGLSWRRVTYGFGNVGLESPTQHAEGVRHVARTMIKFSLRQSTSCFRRRTDVGHFLSSVDCLHKVEFWTYSDVGLRGAPAELVG